MPRQARIDLAGYMSHVIARGTERKKIFLEKEDCEDFLSRFKTAFPVMELTRDLGLTYYYQDLLRGEKTCMKILRCINNQSFNNVPSSLVPSSSTSPRPLALGPKTYVKRGH